MRLWHDGNPRSLHAWTPFLDHPVHLDRVAARLADRDRVDGADGHRLRRPLCHRRGAEDDRRRVRLAALGTVLRQLGHLYRRRPRRHRNGLVRRPHRRPLDRAARRYHDRTRRHRLQLRRGHDAALLRPWRAVRAARQRHDLRAADRQHHALVRPPPRRRRGAGRQRPERRRLRLAAGLELRDRDLGLARDDVLVGRAGHGDHDPALLPAAPPAAGVAGAPGRARARRATACSASTAISCSCCSALPSSAAAPPWRCR